MPNWDNVYVPLDKLKAYLLSETHAIGKSKAAFFKSLGFTQENPVVLERRLVEIAQQNPVQEKISTKFGTKYVIEGTLLTPVGESVLIRTIWVVEGPDTNPRFITAYPI